MRGLEFLDIFCERPHQTLGMLWREDDPRLHLALGRAGHDIHKIDHKFRMRMRDDGEIGVLSFGDLFGDLDIQLIGGSRILLHDVY